MSRPIQFKLLRYALVQRPQLQLLAATLPDPKGRVVEAVIAPGGPPVIFTYRNRQFAFVGFSYGEDKRFLVGTLAKRKTTDIGRLQEREVVEVGTDDWIPVWVVIDVRDQYIAAEINSRFGRLHHVMQVLQAGLQETIDNEYLHDVVVSPVTDSRRFWEIVEEYPLIYRASFKFVSPNFLNTPRRVRELLAGWQDVYNQMEAVVELRNDQGALRVPPEDVGDAVDYIASGEGAWGLEVAEDPTQARRSFSSADSTETFYVEIPKASQSADELDKVPAQKSTLRSRILEVLKRPDETS